MTKATLRLRDIGAFFVTVLVTILMIIIVPFIILISNFYDRQIKV